MEIIGKKKTTLEEIQLLVATGKVKYIFTSSGSCWWSHSEEDVKEATKLGRIAQDKRNEDVLADPKRSEADKKKLLALMQLIKNGAEEREKVLLAQGMKKEDIVGMPCDPDGAPLLQTPDVKKWLEMATSKPAHYGKLGLEAFMRAHHRNCKGRCHRGWEAYNITLLNEN